MKKRGLALLTLLLIASSLSLAAEDYQDIGTAFEIVVTEEALSGAQVNSSSSVTVIDRDEIERINPETTADLLETAAGTSFTSYGSLGSLQTVQIRGASASKTRIYIDGVPVGSAHEGTFDLSAVPPAVIERIEIVKSGSGNLGRTNAIGGMVNIITREGKDTERPLSISFENGSFLPGEPGSLLSLIDSQKIDLSYEQTRRNWNTIFTAGGITAENSYPYPYPAGDGTRELRDNAQMLSGYVGSSTTGRPADNLRLSSRTYARYQDVGTPGSTTYVTPNASMQDLLLTTSKTLVLQQQTGPLDQLKAQLGYSFNRTAYNAEAMPDSTHTKHGGSLLIEQQWDFSRQFNGAAGFETQFDGVESTDIGSQLRLAPAFFFRGSYYPGTGELSLHPSAGITYLSDTGAFSPHASVGLNYAADSRTLITGNLSYSENVPSFSQLYWPNFGNEDLETEKGFNAEIALERAFSEIGLEYTGAIFARNIYNAIGYGDSFIPENIAHSLYLGTEQSLSADLTDRITAEAAYQYNRSWDLSEDLSLSDNIEVGSVRKHTVKGSLSYGQGDLSAHLSGEYLGESLQAEQVLLLNLSLQLELSSNLRLHAAVDNLLNSSYELVSGYPMPGMKIRTGGSWRM